MASQDGCPGVIVSSNRAADVWPYASSTYRHAPKQWDSLFPWEFPQNASREDEECFLRRHFTETEIYMNGGADGEGKGFKFLKSVWYTIAMWNLEVRVPAVEKWFWEQPSNVALLDDPSMKDYYLRQDALVTTFFDAKEVDMYGEKFLTQVIPRIQTTANMYLQQRQCNPEVKILDVAAYMTTRINHELRSRAAPAPLVASAPNQVAKPGKPMLEPEPAQQPPMRSIREDHSNGSDSSMQFCESQDRGFKRGGYGTQRFNRGGPHHVRGAIPFDGRYFREYNSPTGGVPTLPVPMGPRNVSDGFGDHLRFIPHGHPPNGMQQSKNHSFQHQSVAFFPPMQQHVVPHGAPHLNMDQAVWINDTAFTPRFKDQAARYPSREGMPLYEHNNFDPRPRRNSMAGRGKGSHSSARKGTHDRASFGAADHQMYSSRETTLESVRGGKNSHRGRRFSGMPSNWRSGSDHPQFESHDSGLKENKGPDRTSSGPNYSDMHSYDLNGLGAPLGGLSNHGSNIMIHSELRPHMSMQPMQTKSSQLYRSNPRGTIEVGTCGPDWISPKCTIVKKLIANQVPRDLPENELLTMFRRYGDVHEVRRHITSDTATGQPRPSALVFIGFKSAQAARAFLEQKPETWLNGMPLNVEVAKEFWDTSHWGYQKRIGFDNTHRQMVRRDSAADPETPKVPTILRRSGEDSTPFNASFAPSDFGSGQQIIAEVPSEESTPTPSCPSTPKKKGKNKKKTKKLNITEMKPDNLRKISLTANADRAKAGLTGQNASSGASSSVNTLASPAEESKVNISDAAARPRKQETALSQIRTKSLLRAGTEAQSSTEPTYSPTDTVKTQLPMPKADERTDADQESAGHPRGLETTDLESYDEAMNITSNLDTLNVSSMEEHPFRGNTEAKATQKTSTRLERMNLPETLETSPPTSASARVRSRKDVSLTDDSFHTASDSPGTTIESKSEIPIGEKPPVIQLPKMPVGTGGRQDPVADSMTSSSPRLVNAVAGKPEDDQNPQSCSSPKFTVTALTDKMETFDEKKSGVRSVSGSTLSSLTPAFVTATHTLAAGHQQVSDVDKSTDHIVPYKQELLEAKSEPVKSPKTAQTAEPDKEIANIELESSKATKARNKDVTGKSENSETISKAEKQEKAKGPAQTESLSLFGRKKEKKPKPSKKGSMKGKPNMEEKSNTTMGATSAPSKPSSSIKQAGSKVEDENVRAAPGFGVKKNQVGTNPAEVKVAEENSASTSDSGHAGADTSPSKSKAKITNMFNRYFRGGAPSQVPALDATFPDRVSADDPLTLSKEQDLLPKSVTKQNDSSSIEESRVAKRSDVVLSSNEDGTASLSYDRGSPATKINNYVLSERTTPRSDSFDDSLATAEDVLSNPGNGSSVVKSKKKKRKPKKKKLLQGDHAASDTLNRSNSKPRIFPSGENDVTPSSPLDGGSPTSSVTQVGDTFSHPSDSTTNAARKLALSVPHKSEGGVIEPRPPMWQVKKQQRPFTSTEPIDNTEMPGLQLLRLATNSSETADESENGEHTPSSEDGNTAQSRVPSRIYVYVGPGKRTEMRSGGEEMMSAGEQREAAKTRIWEKEFGSAVTPVVMRD